MPRFYFLQIILAVLASIAWKSTEASTPVSSWNDPNSNQYHIQTDEGNERYFRYQTLSGQYRKEKRLEDGTVIGTYAWIDDDGFLRQRDYIADNAGYRILKTKNVYVGRNTPIAAAIKSAKKTPASAGTLVKSNAPNIKSSVTPLVEISHNSLGSTTLAPPLDVSTASPIYPSTVSPSITPNLYLPASTVALSTPQAPSATATPPYSINPWYYTSAPEGLYETPKRDNDNRGQYTFQNGPTYPIDSRGQVYTGNSNNLGNGYDRQYELYDGVSVTNDGFRYYIPRAYHEEQNLPGDKKSGSFGYVDPFGIRRVIYYNAGPGTGFQHRKNNRYVGLNATPYDPRPINNY